MNRRPKLQINTPDTTPEEAAAVAAAIERFLRDTAPVIVEASGPVISPWKQAALSEGVTRQPQLPAAWQ